MFDLKTILSNRLIGRETLKSSRMYSEDGVISQREQFMGAL